MTKEEILNMPAGPEIDALFAKSVMNYHEVGDFLDMDCYCRIVKDDLVSDWFPFNPSTNISHAMEGVDIQKDIEWELGKENGDYYFIIYSPYHEKKITIKEGWKIEVDLIAPTKELAITRALILWAMEKGDNQ